MGTGVGDAFGAPDDRPDAPAAAAADHGGGHGRPDTGRGRPSDVEATAGAALAGVASQDAEAVHPVAPAGDPDGGPVCDGCVGNADDRDPPGQDQDGQQDADSGHECDEPGDPNGGNGGVGDGNPAHTGCVPVPDPETGPPACPEDSEICGTGPRSCPIDTPFPTGGSCEEAAPPVVAPAAETPASVGPAVQASVFGRPSEVLGVQTRRASPTVTAAAPLARTGADPLPLLQLGTLLVLLGSAIVAGSRCVHRGFPAGPPVGSRPLT